MRPCSTILLLACSPLFGQQYTISTLAGDGTPGAFPNSPTSVAVDAAGDVYVGDWSGYVRKIWRENGAVTIVAGTGVLGYGGDGGQATSAAIGRSIAIALDKTGNLYIADGDNNRIRRMDAATGIIATVAGVSHPTGITINSAGDLYFSGSWSQIRKLTANTGLMETIAGQVVTGFGGDNGPAAKALFWDPVPGATDRAGNLYIADYENSRIRMIESNTGIVTTVAGSGACPATAPPLNITVCQNGFAGDGGLATNATLNYAAAVALDSAGNLYIADTINHRIRRVDRATGLIYTIAGNGVSGFRGDGGLAVQAEMTFAAGIAVDSAGRVYFADEANNRIRVLTPVRSPASERFREHLKEAPRH